MIKIKNLQKSFGPVKVLQGLNLNIEPGGIVAILGPNGSGKTTLIKSILGMVIPQSGEIYLSGEPILGEWEYRNQISYMPQIATFPQNLKVSELINMIKNLRNQPTDDANLIADFGLTPFLDKKLATLSGGTRQKVNIVLTFMFDSPLIILDEPTTGLDPVALIYLKQLVLQQREKGKTILITTHIMNLVEELSDHVYFLLEGKIYFNGTVAELKQETGQENLEYAIAEILKENHD